MLGNTVFSGFSVQFSCSLFSCIDTHTTWQNPMAWRRRREEKRVRHTEIYKTRRKKRPKWMVCFVTCNYFLRSIFQFSINPCDKCCHGFLSNDRGDLILFPREMFVVQCSSFKTMKKKIKKEKWIGFLISCQKPFAVRVSK